MTDKHQVVLNLAQMQQLARYELTFDKIIEAAAFEEGDIVCPAGYSYTLDDLGQALRNLKKINPTISDFGENWICPLTYLGDAFDLNRACGNLENENDTPAYLQEFADGLNLSDSDYFSDIWWTLYSVWDSGDGNERLADAVDFDELLARLARYAKNKGKPIEEWRFTKYEKETYIRQFDEDERVKSATENQLALCRKWIEELCASSVEKIRFLLCVNDKTKNSPCCLCSVQLHARRGEFLCLFLCIQGKIRL